MSKKNRPIHNLKAQRDAEIEIRTEVLFGREWTVVPVVAMVEGVRFGANQDSPELGLAADFGKSPVQWNNRPVVLNHPQMDDVFVSANQSADVLNAYCFGLTMNAYVEDSKLKMEVWIDNDRVSDLGDEFQDIVDLIQADDNTVEVSVGFFCDVVDKKGKFKGQAYTGIWQNIVPDHLAILNKGVGACSVEDGCGIPRINKDRDMSKTLRADAKPKTPTAAPKANCACGGAGHDHDHADDTPVAQEDKTPEQLAEERVDIRANIQKLVDQMVGSAMLDTDVRKLITRALNKKFGHYTYLYGFNSSVCVFEVYDYDGHYNYTTFQLGINVSEGKCEFVGEPEEVILQTKIVTMSGNELVSQSSAPEAHKENDVAKDPKTQTETTTETTAAPVVETPAAVTPAPAAAPEVQAAPKVLTTAEYIAQAPAGVREMLEAGMRAHTDRKNAAIAQIKANKGNKFTDETLGAMSIEVLENMVELSGSAVSDYSGRSAPAPITAHQGGGDRLQVVQAPKVFERKTSAAA